MLLGVIWGINRDVDNILSQKLKPSGYIGASTLIALPRWPADIIFSNKLAFWLVWVYPWLLSLFQVAPMNGKDLVAVNEQVQLKALKNYYERWEDKSERCEHLFQSRADQNRDLCKRRLERCQRYRTYPAEILRQWYHTKLSCNENLKKNKEPNFV